MAKIRPLVIAALALGASFAAPCARASDPWPGEAVQPPPDLNIVLYYNAFANAGAYGEAGGEVDRQHTRISVNLQALRYIHTFDVRGVLSGVQLYVPYANFLGSQQIGISNIPGPAGMPAYGPGHEALNSASGFGQPSFGAFVFPYSDPRTNTGLVLGAWVSPPISSYNRNAALNYSQNLWTGELEAGFRTTLAGQQQGRNLGLEIWGEAYFYGSNGSASLVNPAIDADAIPPLYQIYHQIIPTLPASNPLQARSAIPARFSMQPTEELRVYLPYQFYPKTLGTIAPGFYQSFGGKGVYTLADGTKADSGTRTNETQLRLILSTYLSPHWQVALNGEYDLQDHGGPLYRTVELRIAAAF